MTTTAESARRTGKLRTLDEGLRPALAAILALLDVPTDEPDWQALDPLQRRHRTLEAIKRLLLRESLVQPLLVVFDHHHDLARQQVFGTQRRQTT